MEIIIIIVIIAVIMMFISGGLPFDINPDNTALRTLAANQWRCQNVVWTAAPKIENGTFQGTAELVCEVQGLDNGGIARLRTHLLDRVAQTAEKLHGEALPVVYNGMVGVAQDVSVRAEHEGKATSLRGRTQVVSDGAIELTHTFRSTGEDARSASRYLKNLETEMNITSSLRKGWYRVSFAQKMQIDKPFLVPARTFQTTVVQKLEAAVAEKAHDTLTNIANFL